MQRKSAVFASAIAVLMAVSTCAESALIVDTGPGPMDANSRTNVMLYDSTTLGAKFTLSQQTTITSVETWMAGLNDGAFLIGLTHGNYLPAGYNHETFTYFGGFWTTVSDTASWQGVYGKSWTLGPGDYWMVIQSVTGAAFGVAVMPTPSQNPLIQEARYTGITGWYADTLQMGVRIQGTVVPIPPALYLFGSGLITLLGLSKRSKSS